jgi:hypothetical protein
MSKHSVHFFIFPLSLLIYIGQFLASRHGRSYNADHTASRSAQRSQAASSQASITVGDHVRSLDNVRT